MFPVSTKAFILLPQIRAPNIDGCQDVVQKTEWSRYLGKKHQEEAGQIVWDARERGARRRALRVSYQLTAVSVERLLILAHTRSKPNSRQYNHKEALNGKRGERIKGRGQRKKALQTAGLVKVDSGLTERRNKTRRARENPQVVRPGGTPRSE